MGGGTSIEGLGCPGSNDDPSEGIAGGLLAGLSGAESAGDVDPGPTQAAIDQARARTKMIRATVRMSA